MTTVQLTSNTFKLSRQTIMSFRLTLVLLLYVGSVTTIPMTVYNNARFDPTSVTDILVSLFSVTNMNACACQCYNNSLCVTGSYFGINQTCVLFSAHLWQGELQLITNTLASVFSFPNRTTNVDSTNLPEIIEWLFDGNFNDVYGHYNGTPVSNSEGLFGISDILWMSPGYAGYGSAVCFSSGSYSVVDHYLNLLTSSFTISAWILIPFKISSTFTEYFALFSHCGQTASDKCLHIVINSGRIQLGFYGDDLIGNTTLNSNQWYHVAYVYDRTVSKQIVYLNGILDGSRTSSNPYTGNASQTILGPSLSMPYIYFHNGYIDKLTFVSRVKNATELLDEATLVAYYPFDGSYDDAGPNNINDVSQVSTTFDSNGRFSQALVINEMNVSYFQATGFYYLGQANYSYSFSLWIYPFVNNGTILQVSSSNGWCVPMIGFNGSGYLTIQTNGNNGIYATSLISGMLSLNVWTHVSMTYSITNGIRLFVNGLLVGNANTSYDYAASGQMNTVIIGTYLQPNTCGVNQSQIVPSQFQGKIDELKIFSRELSTNEINQFVTSS